MSTKSLADCLKYGPCPEYETSPGILYAIYIIIFILVIILGNAFAYAYTCNRANYSWIVVLMVFLLFFLMSGLIGIFSVILLAIVLSILVYYLC